jgi:RNA polymerase sigma factor (sigma-70 family)
MGMKYVGNFVFNTISLEQILYYIKTVGDDSYYYELINDLDVRRIVDQITNRYSFRSNGFLISKDAIRGIVETELMLMTWKEFKLWKCAQDNIKNGYLAFIYKYLGKKVHKTLEKERPWKCSTKEDTIDEYKRMKDNDAYRYCELIGGINNIELISDGVQESIFKNIYTQDFLGENEDNFEDLIKCLSENQKNILRKIYKENYTEKEIAKENNVSQQSINRAKKRAYKILKKNLKGC